MSERSRIYKSTDWSIWTYVPEADSFILDFSNLNGTDVLGSTGGGLEPLDSQITNVSLTEGGPPTDGTFFELVPMQLNAELTIRDFNISESRKFINGTTIALTLKNESDIDDPIYGFNTPHFIGRIRSFSVNIMPGEDFATVSLNATSKLEDDLNVLMGVEKSTIYYKPEVLEPYLEALGIVFEGPYKYHYASNTFEEKTVGEWISEILSTAATFSYDAVQRNADDVWINIIALGTSDTALLDKTQFNDENISQINLDWNFSTAPTGVTLSLYEDSEINYVFGSTSQSGNGTFNYSATPDVRDLSELIEVGQFILTRKPNSYGPVELTHETAREYQEISFSDRINDPDYLYPTNLALLGETTVVNLVSKGIIDYRTIITGRTMEITPDNWVTTYNLWKGK
jgi:hypothetical protein